MFVVENISTHSFFFFSPFCPLFFPPFPPVLVLVSGCWWGLDLSSPEGLLPLLLYSSFLCTVEFFFLSLNHLLSYIWWAGPIFYNLFLPLQKYYGLDNKLDDRADAKWGDIDQWMVQLTCFGKEIIRMHPFQYYQWIGIMHVMVVWLVGTCVLTANFKNNFGWIQFTNCTFRFKSALRSQIAIHESLHTITHNPLV